MRCLISYVQDGKTVEEYEPKQNALACFLGYTKEQLPSVFEHQFEIFPDDQLQITVVGESLLKYALETTTVSTKAAYIKAFMVSRLNDDTFVQLKVMQ